jgi:hypothetical protein
MRRVVLLLFLVSAACRSAEGEPVSLLDYEAVVPSGLESRPVTSGMRLAEYDVPRGDGSRAEVVVFYFGQGQGGSPDANIARWSSQFTGPAGGPVMPRVTSVEGTSFPTTLAEFEGTYARGVGLGSTTAEPDQALVAAVVETPRGNLFLQLFGDRPAVGDAREDFLAMVTSIRPPAGS